MKAFVGISSGQDGLLALYKTLTETDYEVYAINVQTRTTYAINNINYHDSYRVESINWLRKNCRKFVYDSVIGHKAKWSPRWEGEKDYSEISEENVNDLLRICELGGKGKGSVFHALTAGAENWYSISKAAQELKCDVIIAGFDKIQRSSPAAAELFPTKHFRPSSFITENCMGVPLVYPLEKMGRMQIYHELPKGLKQSIAPCEDYRMVALGEFCGRCRKCLTKKVYEKLYLTEKYTIEELDKVYYNTYINADKNRSSNRSSTNIGMAGLSRLLE